MQDWMGRSDPGSRVDPSPWFEEFHPIHPVSHPIMHSRPAVEVGLAGPMPGCRGAVAFSGVVGCATLPWSVEHSQHVRAPTDQSAGVSVKKECACGMCVVTCDL